MKNYNLSATFDDGRSYDFLIDGGTHNEQSALMTELLIAIDKAHKKGVTLFGVCKGEKTRDLSFDDFCKLLSEMEANDYAKSE